jgi:predicted MFS family arabinose efflux permease
MFSTVFKTPGIARAFLATIYGRLPMGAETLLIVLLVNERTGSFARGGLVAAAGALSHAGVSPLLGRAVDRRGPVRILLAVSTIHCTAMLTLAFAPAGAPLGLSIACAGVAGATIAPLAAVMRTLMSARLDTERRHAALATESVVMELVYICGPLVFVTGIGALSLEAGVAACGLVSFTGTIAFVTAPLLRAWRPEPREGRDIAGALRGSGVRTLILVMVLVGFHVPVAEIAVSAFAEERGSTGGIGPVLAAWGIGSVLGGWLIGRRGAPADPVRNLAAMFAALALCTAAPALATGMVSLGALMLVAGFFIAPSFATTWAVLADVAPRGTVTEANTWMTTGFGTGIALGGALGGWVVEESDPAAGFLMGAAVLLLGAALVAVRTGTLRDVEREPEPALA